MLVENFRNLLEKRDEKLKNNIYHTKMNHEKVNKTETKIASVLK